MSTSNSTLIKAVYAAAARGDIPTVLDALDPNVEWREAESFPYAESAPFVGPRAVGAVLARIGAEVEDLLLVPSSFADAGDTVIVEGKYTGTVLRTGRWLSAEFAHIWQLRDGKVVRFRQYTDTLQWTEALGSAATTVTIELTNAADDHVRKAIVGPLVAYNTQQTGAYDHDPLVLTLAGADGRIIGGLWGRTGFGWLFVELLFVPEPLRRQGFGAELMRRAEREAMARGCHGAWLDTYEFQAPGFYERLGYTCFGRLADSPVGFSRYFMMKHLSNGGRGNATDRERCSISADGKQKICAGTATFPGGDRADFRYVDDRR